MRLGIGMRNIKTAIAVFLCIVVLKFLNMNTPFYACIAAVITMQNTVNVSFKTGLYRMVGTLIGAGVGVGFSVLSPNNLVLTAVGIVIVIYITNLLRQKDSTSIACIVFLAVMTNLSDVTPIHYSALRVLETFVGIVIAMAVNALLYPPENPKEDDQCQPE